MTSISKSAVGPTPTYRGLFPGVERPEREADHLSNGALPPLPHTLSWSGALNVLVQRTMDCMNLAGKRFDWLGLDNP